MIGAARQGKEWYSPDSEQVRKYLLLLATQMDFISDLCLVAMSLTLVACGLPSFPFCAYTTTTCGVNISSRLQGAGRGLGLDAYLQGEQADAAHGKRKHEQEVAAVARKRDEVTVVLQVHALGPAVIMSTMVNVGRTTLKTIRTQRQRT